MGGMRADDALNLARAYVKKTLQGQGALKGQDGFSPTITENADNTDKIYKLDITTADSTFTTPNLRGKDGEGSGGGEENIIDSISVNGVNVAPDENKNVDITVPSIEGLTKDADLATVAKSGNYEDLANKPIIPSLDGYAKTSEIPSKVSELENDNKYQTESDVTTTLANYATKTYVGEQIANAEHLKREIVTVLPSDTEASDNIIYMLKVESATGNDKYKEYMKIDGTVQMVGDTSVDLTDYAKSADIPTTLPANGGNADTVNNHTVETDVPVDAKFTDTVYDDAYIKEEFTKVDNKLTTNLLKPTLGTVKQDGITCTNNGDGTYTFNGTASVRTYFIFDSLNLEKNARLRLIGMTNPIKTRNMYVQTFDGVSQTVFMTDNDGIFTCSLSTKYNVGFLVNDNETCDNILIKPMLTTNLNATYDDFVPYTGSTGQINSDVAEVRKEFDGVNESLSVIGKCKNLLKPTLKTTEKNGVTCTDNGDGTYTLNTPNGAAKAKTQFVVYDKETTEYVGKKIIICGCPAGGDLSTYYISFTGWTPQQYFDTGNGYMIEFPSDAIGLRFNINIEEGVTVNNLVFKPMITTNLNATYDDFVPYTGNGETLASDVAEIKNDLGGLSFSASGTTLTITDGTNTWTLEAN